MRRHLKKNVPFLLILLMLWAQSAVVASAQDASRDAQWVNRVFQKGKAFYESGNYQSALREWDQLDPYLDQYPSFKKVIGYLKNQIRPGSPDDSIRTSLQRGRVAYENGDWKTALAEWKKIEPQLDPSSEEYAKLQKLKKDYETAQLMELRQRELGPAPEIAPEAGSELTGYLQDASQRLQKQILETQARRDNIEKEAVFEQAWIDTTFLRGKEAFEAGDYSTAVAEWDKITHKMRNRPEFGKQVESVKQAARALARAEIDYAAAVDKAQGIRHPAGAGMEKFLQQVSTELGTKAGELSREGGEKQQSAAEQQRRVDQTFEKGKALYLQGKYKEALDEWLLLTSYFEGDPATKSAFLSAQGSLEAYRSAQSVNQESVDSGAYKLKLPEGFFRHVEEANRELAARAREAEAEREKTELAVASKRAELVQAFERGKERYAQGRVTEAVAEWKKLTPWIENGEEFRSQLERLEGLSQETSRSAAALKDAKSMSLDAYAPPAEFAELLRSAGEDLKNQTQAATNERLVLQQGQSEKQARVSNILYKANLAVKAGRIDQAIAEWEKLLPHLDPGAEEKALIESVKQNYEDYTQAAKSHKEVLAKDDQKAGLPDELKAELARTNEEMIRKAAETRARQEADAVQIRDKQATVISAVEKGKVAYQTGRLEQAIAEWEKLLPYLETGAEEKPLLESLKQNHLDSQEAARQLDLASRKKAPSVEVPEDLKKLLSQGVEELRAKTEKARNEREALETQHNERQTWMLSTLEKAKVYTQAGRIGEALEEWKKLLDVIDETSNARSLVRELDNVHAQYLLAEQSLDETLSKKDEKFPVPDGLQAMLSDAQAELASDAQALDIRRADMEKELVQKQAFVDKTFKDGKTLASEGKWLEAIYEWEKLLPHLEEQAGIGPLLQGVKKAWQVLQDSKRSNELFIATRYQDLKLPFTEEMEKMLIELDGTIQKNLSEEQSQRAQMEKSLAEREAWVNATFEKGKAYYDVGKHKEAIEFWSSLAPHLKDEQKLQSLIAGLPQRHDALLQAQQAAQEAEKRKDAPLTPPADLSAALNGLTEQLAAASVEAMSRAEKAGLAVNEKQAAVDQLFAQGHESALNGRWEEAIKTWSALPPYLQEGEKIKAAVDNLAASHAAYAETLARAQQTEARLAARFEAPPDLAPALADAAFKLDRETQTTQLAHERTDKILAEKEAAVQKLYADGKVFYDQGKLADAFAAWRSLLPSVAGENELEALLAKADQSYQMYLSAKDENQQSLAKKEMKLEAPAELSQILETANQQLRDQVFDLKSRSSQTEKMLGDRGDWIGSTFQKGKLAYSQGRYQDAVAEWRTLLPFVANGAVLEQAVSDFDRNLQVSLEASKINAEAEAKKGAKFPAPDELPILLQQLNEKAKNEALEAGAEKIRAEQQYSERQKWLKQTFDLGRSFYLEGKYDPSIAEWEKLSPYLEEGSGMKKLIDAVKESYQASLQAKKAALEATAVDYEGLKLPYAEQMTKLLTEADEKLKEEASEHRAKRDELERTLAERQDWSVTTFNRGKVFYDQGRYDEALDQWERLTPYLGEGSILKERIASLRENLELIKSGKNLTAGTPDSGPPVKLKNEEEVLAVLEEAAGRLRGEAEAARQKKLELEKSFEQREQWVWHTFERGKEFYDQGQYAKAVEEWGVLGPYLTEYPKVRELIEAAKKEYSEGNYAQKFIDSMEAKKSALMPLPAQAEAEPDAVPQAVRVPEPQKEAPATEESFVEVVPSEAAGPVSVAGVSVQLISGEVVSVDEPGRSLTLKLFTESGDDETLIIHFDERTQVDGAEIRPLTAVPSGSAIDVRYNPETSLAQYIYVY